MTLSNLIQISVVLLFSASGIYLSLVDIKTLRIPNIVIVPMFGYVTMASIIIAVLEKNVGWLLIQFGIPCLVFLLFFGVFFINPNGLGMGDIKAILLIGIVLCLENPRYFFLSISSSFLCGAIYVLVLRLFKYQNHEIPFGPFLFFPAVVFAFLIQFN